MHDLLPDWTDMDEAARDTRVRELVRDGHSASVIARYFRCCTRNSIISYCNRREIPMANKSGWAKETIAKGRKAMAERPKPKAKTAAEPKAPKPPKITPPPFETALLPEEDLGNDVTPLIGSVLGLNEHTCKWPIGDPLLPGFGFCGRHSMDGSPYCEDHHKRGTYRP